MVASTVALGVLAISLLGGFLYQRIGDGLTEDRIATSEADAQKLRLLAQNQWGELRSNTTDSLNLSAVDIVENYLKPPSDATGRYVVFARSLDNGKQTVLSTISSAPSYVGLQDVTAELRQRVADRPQTQQVQIITLHIEGEDVPTVVVGCRLEVPVAGPYDLYFFYPMQREQATLALIGRSLLAAGGILTLMLGGIAYVVARQVVTPVRHAAAVARRLSTGDLGQRLSARGEDDLAQLAKSFNEMADSLQRQIRQLETLSRLQQRFVSDVSHELRTPLTTVRMAADLIHDARSDFDPTLARSAELLHGELDRFEALLADLLEISRFDAGAAELTAEPLDLRTAVEQVIEATAPLAARRGSVVALRCDGPIVAEVDERRLDRILRNLVVNAIEHGEGRPITVHLAASTDAVAVLVEDHGVGLRPGEAGLVFTRFWRADPARARTTGGTGLGLAIALEDAHLHGGWLQAWGEPGRGSRFRVTLPRSAGGEITESPLPLEPPEEDAP